MVFVEHDWPLDVFPKKLPFVSFEITSRLLGSPIALLALQERTCRRISGFATAVLACRWYAAFGESLKLSIPNEG